jgi:small ubiquitin-related modifier
MAALIPDESRIPAVVAAADSMLMPPFSGAGTELASRLQRKLGISAAEARKRVTAYKQFLALKAATLDIDATKLSPPPLIDSVWHEHVLDTKRYAPACLLAFGHPIHHDPNGDADVGQRALRREATLVVLEKVYWDDYDEEIWAFPAEAPPKRKRAVVKREGTPASRTRRRTTSPSDDKLKISVRDANGTVTYFFMYPTTPLERVFNAFATSRHVAVMDLHFLFDGVRVRRDQSPADIGMADGDQLDCMLVQQGC